MLKAGRELIINNIWGRKKTDCDRFERTSIRGMWSSGQSISLLSRFIQKKKKRKPLPIGANVCTRETAGRYSLESLSEAYSIQEVNRKGFRNQGCLESRDEKTTGAFYFG